MPPDSHALAAELLGRGDSLWSAVECDLTKDRVIIYAKLHVHPRLDVHRALAESERTLKAVLPEHLEGRGWLAAVHWSGRLCRTFRP